MADMRKVEERLELSLGYEEFARHGRKNIKKRRLCSL